MGGDWHLPYGGTLAGLSDPGEGSSDGELWEQFCSMHPVLPYAMRVRRRVFKGSGPVKPIRGQIHPLNGVVQNLRELRRGFFLARDYSTRFPERAHTPSG